MKAVLAILFLALVVGCSESRVGQAEAPETIRVAVLPDQSRERLLSQYEPLVDYLESATSLRFDLMIPKDYSDLVEQFAARRVDLAWFGGLTFTQAERRSQAVPLAFRDLDSQFTSCYLAQAKDGRQSIAEFAGETFSFGPNLSTSGHLMPRFFLTKAGIDPEQYFASVQYSSAHDETALRVRDGVVALGVANCVIVQSLFETGVISDASVRIVETTPPYSDYVWAVQPTLDEGTKSLLLDAFLALDGSIVEHRSVLRLQGGRAYFPAGRSDFQIIRSAATQAGLLPDEGD